MKLKTDITKKELEDIASWMFDNFPLKGEKYQIKQNN